jgi:hypothetical protein
MVIHNPHNLKVSFKVRPPQVQDILFHIDGNRCCEIISVDPQWGRFTVKFINGEIRNYVSTGGSDLIFRYLTCEELADYRLAQATRNSDDSWREY